MASDDLALELVWENLQEWLAEGPNPARILRLGQIEVEVESAKVFVSLIPEDPEIYQTAQIVLSTGWRKYDPSPETDYRAIRLQSEGEYFSRLKLMDGPEEEKTLALFEYRIPAYSATSALVNMMTAMVPLEASLFDARYRDIY